MLMKGSSLGMEKGRLEKSQAQQNFGSVSNPVALWLLGLSSGAAYPLRIQQQKKNFPDVGVCCTLHEASSEFRDGRPRLPESGV